MRQYKSLVIIFLLAYLLVPLLLGGNSYVMSLLVASLIIGGVALAWALLGNLGGMVSFGHAAFFGVGAYVSALLSKSYDLPVLITIFLAGFGASIVSIVMLPVLRLRGPYFALAILAYAHIFRIISIEWESLTGGAGGLSNIPRLPTFLGIDLATKTGSYLLVLSLLLLFVIIYIIIRQSSYGIALRAMHDSEDATRVVGVNSVLLKAMMLFVSAFMTGIIGAFNVHYINFLDPDYAFSGNWVMLPIIAAIFGGYRTIYGPIIGAVTIYMVDQLIFKSIMPTGHQLVLGSLLVAMIILSPNGLLPLVNKVFVRKSAKPEVNKG